MSDFGHMRERCGAVAQELRKMAAKSKTFGPRLLLLADVLEERKPNLDNIVDLDKRVEGAK